MIHQLEAYFFSSLAPPYQQYHTTPVHMQIEQTIAGIIPMNLCTASPFFFDHLYAKGKLLFTLNKPGCCVITRGEGVLGIL